jgi:hypothetical protein
MPHCLREAGLRPRQTYDSFGEVSRSGISQSFKPEISRDISPVRLRRRVLWFSFAAISLVYLAQVVTPLRLINDGGDYLMQASSAVDGHGFQVHGMKSMRPVGYPFLIFLLIKTGLGRSWAFVSLNCLFLGLGCWATYHLLRRSFCFSCELSQFLVLLTLLSFVFIRNVTYPLSDLAYFGASAACLLVLLHAEQEVDARRRLSWLLLVAPLVGFCVELRTIGIVLIPPLLWSAFGGKTGANKLTALVSRHPLITMGIASLLVLAAGRIVFESRYMKFNLPIFQHRGVLGSVLMNLRDHTTEWGEATLNAPTSKLPQFLKPPLQVVGMIAILAAALGIWVKGTRVDSLMLYVIGFAAIVFAYPWLDTRLWLPVLPFLMAYVLRGLQAIVPNRLRRVSIVYCSGYCLLGILALAYSTRITFAGSRFPDLFGDENARATYRLAMRGEQPARPAEVDADFLYLLCRYDRRCAEPVTH